MINFWWYFTLIAPIFMSNFMEIFYLYNIFSSLNIPINTNLFGENKRIRGLVTFPIGLITSYHVISFIPIQDLQKVFSIFNWKKYSIIAGLIFNLAELPNSYIKRRLNIKPGCRGKGIIGFLFLLIDHCDSVYPAIFIAWLCNYPEKIIKNILITAPLMHLFHSFILRPILTTKVHTKKI